MRDQRSGELRGESNPNSQAPAETIRWWRKGGEGSSCVAQHEAPGRSRGSLLDRHPRRICANMSRHSRKRPGPDGMADSTTLREGSLNAFPTSFARCTVPLASLAGHFSLHHFLAVETLSYETRNTDLSLQPIRVKTLSVPNLCKDGDVERV